MALKFLTPIDLNNNELRNVVVHLLGTDPGSPTEGQIWYNTAGHTLKLRLASSTVDLQNPVLFNSNNAAFYLNRVNHTGTQVASTISDFDIQVRTSRLDQMAAPNTDLSINGQKLINVADPGSATDGATKGYVDSIAQGGVYWKQPVRAGTLNNITISAPGSLIDNVSMVAGDRIALMGQSPASANGIYIWNGAATPATRASDSDTSAEVKSGMSFWVNEGSANADTAWTLTTNDPITLGTTSLTFVQFSGLGQVVAGNGLTKSGNTLNVVGTANRLSVAADSIDIDAAYVGQTSITTLGTIGTGTWNGTTIAVANGGTGATTASGARTNLGATGKYSATIGDGSTTAINVTSATHGLGSTNQLIAAAYEVSSNNQIICDIAIGATGTVTFTFAIAPASNAIRIVIIG
jgi:hypothetical protein